MEFSSVYAGGSAVEVCCANPACTAKSTSGSWRRGWLLDRDTYANLCNRCGQKWLKNKEAFSKGTLIPPRIPPAIPKVVTKRDGQIDTSTLCKPTQTATSMIVEDATRSSSYPKEVAGKEAHGVGASTPASKLVDHVKQGLQNETHSKCFVSYTIQKQSSSRGNHALFWLQDSQGTHTLAVVGTDARLSGHFTYTTTPTFVYAPPLRCTNRTEVTQWLAGFGVTELVSEGSVCPLPELSAADKKELLTGEPVWAKPQIDMTPWTAVREESGRLTDGRHFKRFFLLGQTGHEKLAVIGVDSMRKDRRYKYHAQEAMGGFTFENSREVLDWLNFILDRNPSDPIDPEQVRAPQPLAERELTTAAASTQSCPSARPKKPGDPGTKPGPKPKKLKPGEAPGNPQGQGGDGEVRRRRPRGDVTAGSDEAEGGWGRRRREGDAGDGLRLRVFSPGSQEGEAPGEEHEVLDSGGAKLRRLATKTPHQVPIGGKVRPKPPPALLAMPRFRCACCGMTDHDTDECPLAALSPTTLIRRPTLDRGIFQVRIWGPQDPSLMEHPSADGLLSPVSDAPVSSPSTPIAGIPGPGTSALQQMAGERNITEAVKDYPLLHRWVATAPSMPTVERFRAWAERLGGHISDHPPPPSSSPDVEPLGGWRWVSTSEALYILQELDAAQVNLALLEGTEISRAVAMLRTHKNDDIARLAESIVAKWRKCAVAALHHATSALAQTQ